VPEITIYHHDPVEVDPNTSWTGLSPALAGARLVNVTIANQPEIVSLFDYARPDAVVAVDGVPAVAIEQTQMNPSGHNIPQRFSCLVRAAEVGVPGILYYPEYSRRTFSDPKVRYVQVRVPLANMRLTGIYGTPSLSVFWPTDSKTLLPDTGQAAQQNLADLVTVFVENIGDLDAINGSAEVENAMSEMRRVVQQYAGHYRRNPTVSRLIPDGYESVRNLGAPRVDPPPKATLVETRELIRELKNEYAPQEGWNPIEASLMQRDLSLVFPGTTNRQGTDSEHPWPGYLTLLDILYTRLDDGVSPTARSHNLIYALPVDLEIYLERLARINQPTATHIVDCFADLIHVNGGLIPGRPIRGEIAPQPVLLA
jgi:hypothetical protein